MLYQWVYEETLSLNDIVIGEIDSIIDSTHSIVQHIEDMNTPSVDKSTNDTTMTNIHHLQRLRNTTFTAKIITTRYISASDYIVRHLDNELMLAYNYYNSYHQYVLGRIDGMKRTLNAKLRKSIQHTHRRCYFRKLIRSIVRKYEQHIDAVTPTMPQTIEGSEVVNLIADMSKLA